MKKVKKDFYSVTEVADLLGVTRQAIIDRIKRGTLETMRLGHVYMIPKSEADRVRAEKR
ncbi:MAG: helix-turn-helix domain-containing protein [Candidatus Omnitrophica bacterium]|nr:helix-turn-helix domain-containing protein [Candidatus Omnitrophota bacterium]